MMKHCDFRRAVLSVLTLAVVALPAYADPAGPGAVIGGVVEVVEVPVWAITAPADGSGAYNDDHDLSCYGTGNSDHGYIVESSAGIRQQWGNVCPRHR